MFMLSRDRLNMDLDQETLNLMLRLLGVDQQEDLGNTLTPTAARALKRNRDKVEEVYDQFQKEAGSKLDNVEIESLTVSSCVNFVVLDNRIIYIAVRRGCGVVWINCSPCNPDVLGTIPGFSSLPDETLSCGFVSI